MKILIIGGGGMLGHKLVQTLNDRCDVWTTIRGDFHNYEKYKIFERRRTIFDLDVSDTKLLEREVEKIKPDVIINAVGVIKQIKDSNDVIKTLNVNSIFPHKLADIAEKYDSRLICISTDCVFNGEKGNYTEEEPPDAYDLYGKSKNLGEVVGENCLTLRTSIIGRELQTSNSLVEWFLSNKDKKVRGFANAIFSGFPTIFLAEILYDLIVNFKKLSGLYHVSSEPINKFDLLKLIKEAYNIDIEIERFEDFKIDRSLNSTKFRKETGFNPPDWKKLLEMMANDPTHYDIWK